MKTAIRITAENTVTKRNPVAAALRLGQFRRRVVRSKKDYVRNDRNRKDWE
jgi:hypothetical protein